MRGFRGVDRRRHGELDRIHPFGHLPRKRQIASKSHPAARQQAGRHAFDAGRIQDRHAPGGGPIVDRPHPAHVGRRGEHRLRTDAFRQKPRKTIRSSQMAGQEGDHPTGRLVDDHHGGVDGLAARMRGDRAHGDPRRAHEHQSVGFRKALARPSGKRLLIGAEPAGHLHLGILGQACAEAMRLAQTSLGESDQPYLHGCTTMVAK